jgi:hypothetical protein
MDCINIAIELGRTCQLECGHCLRGESKNRKLKRKYIDSLFNQIKNIDYLSFTGGEPSLNIDLIEYTLEVCKEKEVSVNNFYIATNGVNIRSEFAVACLKWYAYCLKFDGEYSSIEWSNTAYHRDAYAMYCYKNNIYPDLFEAPAILKGLSFYRPKYEGSLMNDYMCSLIKEGRASGWSKARELREDPIKDFLEEGYLELWEIDFMLNCHGNILTDCDFSYESQKNKKNIFCHVDNFKNKLEDLLLQRKNIYENRM